MKDKEKIPMPSDVIMTPEMTLDEYYAARKAKRAEFFDCMKQKRAEIMRVQHEAFGKQLIELLIDKKINEIRVRRLEERLRLLDTKTA